MSNVGLVALACGLIIGLGANGACIGIGVMGGMLAATILGVFFVPLLFVTVRRLFPGKRRPASEVAPS